MHKVYQASPTFAKFHADDSFVRAVMGPFGSGKSVGCLMDLVSKAMQQKPNSEGVRRTKWCIVRNSYRELEDTTMETFFEWIPRNGMGRYLDKTKTFTMRIPLPDGTIVESHFIFRALDKPGDIRKVLSTEYTGGFLNEVREIPKAVLDALPGRFRYPPEGATWQGLVVDTNPPDSDHWFYTLFEVDRPEGFRLFKQPSGLAPDAENLENLNQLPADERKDHTLEQRRERGRIYYSRQVPGKTKDWVNVYIHGEYGLVMDGKPIWPEYKDGVHAIDDSYVPVEHETVYVGIDFGLTPAAVFAQKDAKGRWYVFDELVCEDMGAQNFSKLLNEKINKNYPHHTLSIHGDPAGDFRAQTDETTPFQILRANGIAAIPTYTNDFVIRREAVAAPLQRLDFAGNPGLAVTPGAPMARKALAGGYCYRRLAVTGAERFQDRPDKMSKYSHIGDALQYCLIGAGEGGKLIEDPTWGREIDYETMNKLVI